MYDATLNCGRGYQEDELRVNIKSNPNIHDGYKILISSGEVMEDGLEESLYYWEDVELKPKFEGEWVD